MQNADVEQLRQLACVAEKCIHVVKSIRKKILTSHELLANGFETELDLMVLKKSLEKYAVEITDEYGKLEDNAKQLPSQTPLFTLINRLNVFLLDISKNTYPISDYYNTRDVANWLEVNGLYINYLCDMFKPTNISNSKTRRLVASRVNGIATPNLEPLANLRFLSGVHETPHIRFENNFQQFLQKHNHESNRLKFAMRYLERSTLSSVMELKLLSTSKSTNDYVTVDKQPVCLLKFLCFVNNGLIEYVHFIAPHEDWSYMETSQKQIDVSVESRYDLYRRITIQGNVIVNAISYQYPIEKATPYLLSYFSRLYIIDQPCKQCKKILKDFLPSFIIPERKVFYHLSCK